MGSEDVDSAYSRLSVFMETCITEEQFNSHITNIQNLPALHAALEVKLCLVQRKKHAPFDFPVNHILEQISATNINEICHVLEPALRVQSNQTQYAVLLNYINKNLNNEETTLSSLKLLKLALSFCDEEKFRANFVQFPFWETICSLLHSDSKTLANVTLNILPMYLKYDDPSRPKVLEKVWENALKSKQLDILCTIPEFFLPFGTNPSSCSLVIRDEFWFLLQECLIVNNNSNLQKQALFLLKQGIRSLKNQKGFETEPSAVVWNFQNETAWQNLFMLFEICKEKQLHLIEPAYHLLPTIKILHSSWLICVYELLLNHSHNAVSAFAVVSLMGDNWYDDGKNYKSILKRLIFALNKIEFVQKEEIWASLSEFSKKLNDEKFEALLQESAVISWIPPVCYQFYVNILTRNQPVIISVDLMQSMLNNIAKLPHKFIRNECANLVANFTYETFLSHGNFCFKYYITLCSILCNGRPQKNPGINFNEHIFSIEESVKSWKLNESVNLNEVTIILKILELCSVDDDWLKSNLLKPLMENRFSLDVANMVHVFLHLKGIESHTATYLQNVLINLKPDTKPIDKNVLLLLSQENQAKIFQTCSNILLNEVTTNSTQIEAAFVTVALLPILENGLIDEIVQRWRQKFHDGCKDCSTETCIAFLKLYCDRELRRDCINETKTTEIIMFFEKLMDTQSNAVIPEIFSQLKFLLQESKSTKVIIKFTNLCLRKLIELKRTDLFKPAVANFTLSLFSNWKMCQSELIDEELIKNNVAVAWTLLDLAKSSEDVAFNLTKQLRHLSECNPKVASKFIPIIAELLLFGDVLKKDQRAEYMVCQKISRGTVEETNPIFEKLYVRAQNVNIVQDLLRHEEAQTADALTLLLINKYLLYFNKRYFADSQIHLQKLRVLQALLLAYNYVETQKQPLIDLLLNSLTSESHQISIRFLIIWLLIRLLRDNKQCAAIITAKMESTNKIHSCAIIAFIPILYHVALWKSEEGFFNNLLEIMLLWTMGPHFNLRLYAQEGIVKLFQAVRKRGYSKLCEKFRTTITCIENVLEKTKRSINDVDRFIFDSFNPQDHYNLRTIYFDIPLITNVTGDEYENFLSIHEFNTPSMLPSSGWTKPSVGKTESANQKPAANWFQKKIVPNADIFETDVQRRMGELIVVASLIDKPPNLGGLSRTCEIFGVKQLVVNSLAVVKNQEFQSVSMSSENWVDIAEAKIDQLQTFLLQMKENGYSIVGAEQTSDSAKLYAFRFPKKSVLLLGNEKEGVPPNLLSLIDTCVEIPQFGVVRSLNVHVAAATFIWEYTKQHLV